MDKNLSIRAGTATTAARSRGWSSSSAPASSTRSQS
jgi:hypothetical protein